MEVCPSCGGDVQPVAKANRHWMYRGRYVPLPAETLIPACVDCHRVCLEDDERKVLRPVLEAAWLRVMNSLSRVR